MTVVEDEGSPTHSTRVRHKSLGPQIQAQSGKHNEPVLFNTQVGEGDGGDWKHTKGMIVNSLVGEKGKIFKCLKQPSCKRRLLICFAWVRMAEIELRFKESAS